MNTEVSIVIVNYNNKELLINLIKSIYNFTKSIIFEVIVVDNASTDDSVESVIEKFPEVILSENKENLGYSKAINKGIKISKGNFICFLNEDMLFIENSIKKMTDFIKENKECAAVCCKLLNPDRTLQIYPMKFPPKAIDRFKKRENPYNPELFEKNREVDYCVGAGVIMRKNVLEKLGGWDEDYFLFAEEIDLGYRIKKMGWKNYFIPKTSIIHFGETSTKKYKDEEVVLKYNNIALKSFLLFYRKNYGLTEYLFMKSIFLMKDLIKFVKNKEERKNTANRLKIIIKT